MSSTWVSKTLVLIRNAFNTGAAHVILRTSTLLPMSDALATRVDTTGLGKQTEVDRSMFRLWLFWLLSSQFSATVEDKPTLLRKQNDSI